MFSGHSLYPVAVHLFLRRGDELLMLRRSNTGYEDGNYSVVAGHVEIGETVSAAAVREAREEVGIRMDESDLTINGVMHRRSEAERVDFFVECTRWEGTVENREPDKCDDLRWVARGRWPENTIPYIKRALSMNRSGMWFDQFGWNE